MRTSSETYPEIAEIRPSPEAPAGAPPVAFPRRSLACIVIVGFLLRLVYMLATSSYTPFDRIWGLETRMVALSIATGHGFGSPFGGNTGPTAWLTPVYPYMAAGVFRLLGMRLIAASAVILTINSLFAALTCIPIFLIGEKLGSRRIGLWAAFLWAILPTAMPIPATWIWETSLSTLLLSLVVLLTLRLDENRGLLPWFGFGLLWGVVALTNPALTSFLPVSGLWAAWQSHRRGRRVLAPVVVASLACLATLAPWFVRNYEVFGRFIFLRSNFAAEMRYGNTVYARGIWACCNHPSIDTREFRQYAQLGEIGYVEAKRQEVADFIHRYPGLFASLTLRRMIYFWNGVPDVTSEDLEPHDMVKTWPYLALSAMGVLGLVELLRRRKKGAGLLAGLFLIYPLPYYITYPMERYRHPLEPLFLVLAVFLLAQTRDLRRYFYPDSPE